MYTIFVGKIFVIKCGKRNSKKPNKFKANKNSTSAIIIKNRGCWNCIPQPILIPANLKLNKTMESNKKEKIIPIAVVKKLFLVIIDDDLLSNIESNLIDNTGKTQGITFNIMPPIRAINRM